MARWVRFFTIDGAQITYGPDAAVRTLGGGEKPAGDCAPDETVLVEVWNARTGKSARHQAMRDGANWKAMLRKCDGSGAAEHYTPRSALPDETPALQPPRRTPARGTATVSVRGDRVALTFAAWIKASVRNLHRDAALALAAMDAGGTVGRDEVRCAPERCAEVAAAMQRYLLEHGFMVVAT